MSDIQDVQPSTPQAPLDEATVRVTLHEFLQCASPAVDDTQYRVVGTAATLLYGIALPASDIDLLCKDREAVDRFDQALSTASRVTRQQAPIWLPGSRQYFARYAIKDVVIELSTVEFEVGAEQDWFECIGRGPWERFQPIQCGAYVVPTVAVELRLLTELSRERPTRYRPILNYLQTRPCHVDLIQRGMTALQIPHALQHEVLASIKPNDTALNARVATLSA